MAALSFYEQFGSLRSEAMGCILYVVGDSSRWGFFDLRR